MTIQDKIKTLADIILNGEDYIDTGFGTKTHAGLCDLISRQALDVEFFDLNQVSFVMRDETGEIVKELSGGDPSTS